MTRRWLHFPLAAWLFMHSTAALADETDALRALLSQDIVTTASAEAESAHSAPATSVTLRADELRVYGIRTLDEAIQFLALGVVSANNLKTPELGARGVLLPGDNGKHFLLLINGHAVNDPLYGAARFDEGLGIPLEIVDRIEVVIGPGSVLYGSSAMLGVINVFTKSEKDYRGGHVYGEYELERSARVGAGTGFHFDLLGERAELTAAVEYFRRYGPDLDFDEQIVPVGVNAAAPVFRRGGPADGRWGGTVRKAYFTDAPAGTLRLRIGDFDINASASIYRRGIPYTSGTADVDFDDSESYELDRAIRLDVKHEATPSSLVQVTSRAYADGFDYQRRVTRNALEGCVRTAFETCQLYTAGRARWLGIEERLSLNWLESADLVTVLGVDARMRWVSAKEDTLNFDTGEAVTSSTGLVDDSALIVSPYVQQTYRPTRWLDLNAGARLDIDERFSSIVSPRGAVALTPFESTTVKAIYSQAFRS
ncbi:MAG TPA: TonB-dependent receptor, partial [Polyangiaceae bacterium]|nr:TonB-dependent receptor [Polyangiaceae bacterium]